MWFFFLMLNSDRIHGLDVLRAMAMILGIFLHGAIAYKKGYHYGYWVFDKENSSYFFDWLYLWINSFRMQLFFLLAGFFARLLINKIGIKEFCRNRLKRVGLPLLISYFTILPLTLAPYLYVQFLETGDPWKELADFFSGFFTLRSHSGFMHLWFLQHLLLFYFLTFMLFMFFGLRKPKITFWNGNITTTDFVLITVLITVSVSQLFNASLPFIWTGFIIPIPQVLYYASFFALGWILENNRSLLISFQNKYKIFLILGSLLSIVVLYLLNTNDSATRFSTYNIALKLLFAVQTVLLIVGFLGLFTSIFKKQNPFWRYIADAAYWVYLIHLPLVLTTQLVLVNSSVPGILRFLIVIVISLVISFLTYHYWVRFTWVGLMLNGKRATKNLS